MGRDLDLAGYSLLAPEGLDLAMILLERALDIAALCSYLAPLCKTRHSNSLRKYAARLANHCVLAISSLARLNHSRSGCNCDI